jgi:hypothetical protein
LGIDFMVNPDDENFATVVYDATKNICILYVLYCK